MQVVYTGEEMPPSFTKSMFLAGPSLRPGQEKDMTSWRQDALKVLEDVGFDGVVFCPENRGFDFPEGFDYDQQVAWEEKCLNAADVILFWVPRKLPQLPAFTTNIEWGVWADSGKVVLGYPEGADKMTYLQYYADKFKVPVSHTLTATITNAIEKLGEGEERSGGERYVPLFIWQLDSFQHWYRAQTKAGNVLEDARLMFNFRPAYKDFVFMWVLWVKVYISSEDRYKENELVLSRPSISSVMLWRNTGDSMEDTQVILIKEFRSPASTPDGFIHELPSGGLTSSDPEENAVHELQEETGFYLTPSRLKSHQSRQLAGTFSAHHSYLYSAELTEEELEWFRAQDGIAHGVEKDSERTFVEVLVVRDLLQSTLTDWSTLGQIFAVLFS